MLRDDTTAPPEFRITNIVSKARLANTTHVDLSDIARRCPMYEYNPAKLAAAVVQFDLEGKVQIAQDRKDVRLYGCTVMLFPNGNAVSVGATSVEESEQSFRLLRADANLPEEFVDFEIHNIVGSANCLLSPETHRIDIQWLSRKRSDVEYSPHRFPGASMKFEWAQNRVTAAAAELEARGLTRGQISDSVR